MKNQEAISRFVELTKDAYKSRLKKIILFGSYARKEETESSDIDLLIILNDDQVVFSKESKRLSSLVTEIAINDNVWISPKPTSLGKFQSSEISLFQTIKKEGVTLYG